MNNRIKYCNDVGSEYCPCYLAETNDCITCSHLQGKNFCNCEWKGTCVYNEFHFLGNKKRNYRETNLYSIVDRKLINKLIILTVRVTEDLAKLLKHPGSYVFMRNKNTDHYYDVPMSIMDVDEKNSLIKVAVEIRGPKTKLLSETQDLVLIRGPYWNGILGLDYIKQMKAGRCLVLARGIAQAPALLVIKYLLQKGNEVDVIIDKGKINYHLINRDYHNNIQGEVDFFTEEGQKFYRHLLSRNDYQLLFISGSDRLQETVKLSLKDFTNIIYAYSNNCQMCCGEGICGACNKRDKDGKLLRMCKIQVIDN